jgi:hypothetical protein
MKKTLTLLLMLFALVKIANAQIPNSDFENWTGYILNDWEINGCALCLPPIETYIVQQDTNSANVYHGKSSVKLVYNLAYPATA